MINASKARSSHRRCSAKKTFLKILQILQDKTCLAVFTSATLSKKDYNIGFIWEQLFSRASENDCSYKVCIFLYDRRMRLIVNTFFIIRNSWLFGNGLFQLSYQLLHLSLNQYFFYFFQEVKSFFLSCIVIRCIKSFYQHLN